MNTQVMFSSEDITWATPQEFFDMVNEEFNFNTDVCATRSNAKCKHFFSPQDDGLSQKWEGVCWMNPPYGSGLKNWIAKAFNEAKNGTTVVALIPARTDTKYFHDYILPFSNFDKQNTTLAYLAGIIDGEGCIRVDKKNPTKANRLKNPVYSLKISVKMTDFEIVEYFQNYFNCGSLSKETFENKKDILRWEAVGEDAYEIIRKLYPYLRVKKSQAFEALQFQQLKRTKVKNAPVEPSYLESQQEYFEKIRDLKITDNKKSVSTEIRFIKGRLKFSGAKTSAPFPSMLVIFKPE